MIPRGWFDVAGFDVFVSVVLRFCVLVWVEGGGRKVRVEGGRVEMQARRKGDCSTRRIMGSQNRGLASTGGRPRYSDSEGMTGTSDGER